MREMLWMRLERDAMSPSLLVGRGPHSPRPDYAVRAEPVSSSVPARTHYRSRLKHSALPILLTRFPRTKRERRMTGKVAKVCTIARESPN